MIGISLIFLYFPRRKNNKIIISDIPLKEDFHLSKGFLREATIEYYFNITIATEFEVDIVSDEPFNFKLYNYQTNTSKMERKWCQFIYDYVVLKRGIWVISIAPSNSKANGRIEVTTRTPFYPAKYVHISATREIGGLEIVMNYEDELEETTSVHLSIQELPNETIVWNYTINGEKRNKFTIIWNNANQFRHYVVQITVNHRVFGGLSYRNFMYGHYLSP